MHGVQAALESEARFSSMVRHSSDVLSLLAPDQTIRFIRPLALRVYDYATEVLNYTSMLDLLHPEDRPRAQSILVDALTRGTGMSAATEWRLLHGDGGWRDIETIATNLTDDPAVGGSNSGLPLHEELTGHIYQQVLICPE
jgi:PAS domain S-box-containing protein